MRQMHLNKSGSGISSTTACGRSVMRTPMSTNWEQFKTMKPEHQCAKCAASKQAELNRKKDAEHQEWEAEESKDWFEVDKARIEEIKAKRK